jgi:hypothetical protein
LHQEGILGSGASVLPSDGSFYREYTFEGRAGHSVTINLTSPDFDTYLAVLGSDRQLINENDDVSQGDSDSQLTFTLPRTGVYSVVVNARDRGGCGRYVLNAR